MNKLTADQCEWLGLDPTTREDGVITWESLTEDQQDTLRNAEGVDYPYIYVTLTDVDSNVFNLIGVVRVAMRRAGCANQQIKDFIDECMRCKSYDEVLVFMMNTVHVR